MHPTARAVLVASAIAACGKPDDRAPRPEASPSAPPSVIRKAAAPEAAKPAALTPGAYVVMSGVGIMKVEGPNEIEGKPGVKLTSETASYTLALDAAADLTVVRAVISKAEAERRLALLEDTTPVTDPRPAQQRNVERMRTLARGTDLEQLALLRAQYASTFAAGPRDMVTYHLEDRILPELAHVLGTTRDKLAERLHAVHAVRGAFAKTAPPRPSEPAPVPPKDPWGVKGHDYVGTFALDGETLVAGDPIYVTSKHDEPRQAVTKNVRIPATPGRWLCYLELDPQDPSGVTLSLIAIHESANNELAGARRKAAAVARLWVDSGQMAVADAGIRDDAVYDDARLFGADDHGVIADRGCKVASGAGDGTYTTRVLARDGKAIYVHVDFTGESRDFLKDARSKLKVQ